MSEISTNNVTDIDDNTILANTPMMVVESGDTTLAEDDPAFVSFMANVPEELKAQLEECQI